MGKNVPQRMVKQTTSKSRLLNRKLDSRETSDSSLCSLLRCDWFCTRKKTQTARVRPMKTRNQVPIEDCAKACTELMTPERVRKVPSMESRKVAKIERHVPDFQHAAFFLHHDRVQERRAGEPRHERGVFYRIPAPVAAPAQDGVGPVCAEKDSNRQEAPRHHGPAAGDVDPLFAGILHDERAQGEGEGDGEADVSQVKHGRMNDHLGILQQRIQAGAVRGKALLARWRTGGRRNSRSEERRPGRSR